MTPPAAVPGLEQIQEGMDWLALLLRTTTGLAALIIVGLAIWLYNRHQLWYVETFLPAVLDFYEKIRNRS